MSKNFHLAIQDSTGRTMDAPLDPTAPLSVVAQETSLALGLTQKRPDGTPLRYQLFDMKRGRLLNMELSAYGHGLRTNELLRLLPIPRHMMFELVLQSEPNPGMLFPLRSPEVNIGRDFGNQVVIRHKSVSRQHGVFEWMDGVHVYMDLGSANGSWINHQPVTQLTPIAEGDVLMLGQIVHLVYRERPLPQYDDADSYEADLLLSQMRSGHESRTNLMSIPKLQLFLSYLPAQTPLAEAILHGLSKVGILAWHIHDDLEDSLRRSQALVVVLTRDILASEVHQNIWSSFYRARKPAFIIMTESCPIPESLQGAQTLLTYTGDIDSLLGDLVDALQKLPR
jgi:pSer/pThr/pTyr-binding forkhead associated (FHA) protein